MKFAFWSRGGRGTGKAVPAKSVSPGSVFPRFRSPGLSPESQSPGSLSPPTSVLEGPESRKSSKLPSATLCVNRYLLGSLGGRSDAGT